MAVRDLINILSWQRASGSKSEATFVYQFISTIPGIQSDEYGNYHLQVGDEDPLIMWSCHTDTVTRHEGRQNVKWISKGILGLNNGKTGQCLGADDGAGVWLMMEMIKAGKPGYYVFHRDEECGGLGSTYLKENPQYFPPTIKIAIAMDRAGKTDVITHQAFSRCCSDTFARSLAAELGLGFMPDDTGVFTDTANYTGLFAECTNLSVGYERNHGPMETLDVDFLQNLLKALLALDQTKLIVEREPGAEDEYAGFSRYSSGYYAPGASSAPWDMVDDVEDRWQDPEDDPYGRDHLTFAPSDTLDYTEMVRKYPNIAARLLEELGIEPAEMRAHIFAFSGHIV